MSTFIICSMCGESVEAETYEPDKSLTCPECTGQHDGDGDGGTDDDEYPDQEAGR